MLAQSVSDVSEKLKTLKEAEKQAQEQLKKGDMSQAQYDALKREIIATEKQLKDLEKQAAASNATLAKMGAIADDVASGAGKLADKTKVLSASAGAALVAIGGLAYNAVTSADDLNTLAKQTGFTTEELQKMQYASDLIDVNMEDITSAAAKMTNKLRTSEDSFSNLGIAIRDSVSGELLSTDQIFKNTIAALSQIENETERDKAAMEIFGKSANELAGVIDDGGAALEEYGAQAENLGLIMSQETLDNLNDVNDKIDELKGNLKGTLAKTGAKALDALAPVLEDVANGIGKVLEFVGNLDEGTIKIILTILAVVAALSPVLSIISTLSAVFSAIIPVIAAFNAVLAANPIILIVMAIAALIAGFVLLWNKCEGFRNFFIGMWEGIKKVVKAVIDWFVQAWEDVSTFFSNLWEGIASVFKSIWEGIKQAFKLPINWIINGINKFIRGINKIKVPDWVPAVGGKSFHINELPLLAKGGVLERGQVGLLEGNGAEAVVPLDQNRKWIAAVAQDMMSACGAMQSGAPMGTQINIYPQSLDNSTIDYLFARFDAKMGAMA